MRLSMSSSRSSLVSTNSEIIIIVMGPTGAGKSTFINTLLGKNVMEVGRSLMSCTKDIASEAILFDSAEHPSLKDFKFTIVDTPGFDDTYTEDSEILQRIANWLENAYRRHRVLGGVIYLHDITHNRFSGTCRRNLELFQKLCGDDALSNVLIGTTQWGRVNDKSEADRNVSELESVHWRSMIDHGASTAPFQGTQESAIHFIETIMAKKMYNVLLQLQTELVDQKKILPETEVGKQLRFTLQEILDMQKKTAKFAKNLVNDGNKEAQDKLRETRDLINSLSTQIKDLKIPLSRRLRKTFGFL